VLDHGLLLFELLQGDYYRLLRCFFDVLPFSLGLDELVRYFVHCVKMLVIFHALNAIQSLAFIVRALNVQTDVEYTFALLIASPAVALGGCLGPLIVKCDCRLHFQ
jgi:hypothetical protein